jgi:hypothetical protein
VWFGRSADRHGVVKALINTKETVTRVVGKRTQAPDGLSTRTSRNAYALACQQALGGVRVPRGVHRFKTHEDADRWRW